MSPSDAAAWGALIASTAAAIVSIIIALRQPTIAQKVEEVHAAVSTANGHTLGELAEGVEARAVTRGEAPTPTLP